MEHSMEESPLKLYEEACWPISLVWERINHAYTSDAPPYSWGLQKGESGFQTWVFQSQTERFTVVWNATSSYWKVNSPWQKSLFFIGPFFIDKSRTGLHVPPLFTVVNSDKDILRPANPRTAAAMMVEIGRYVIHPNFGNEDPKPTQ